MTGALVGLRWTLSWLIPLQMLIASSDLRGWAAYLRGHLFKGTLEGPRENDRSYAVLHGPKKDSSNSTFVPVENWNRFGGGFCSMHLSYCGPQLWWWNFDGLCNLHSSCIQFSELLFGFKPAKRETRFLASVWVLTRSHVFDWSRTERGLAYPKTYWVKTAEIINWNCMLHSMQESWGVVWWLPLRLGFHLCSGVVDLWVVGENRTDGVNSWKPARFA